MVTLALVTEFIFASVLPSARLEGQVVLRVILQRLQDLTLDTDDSKKNEKDILSPLQSVFFHGMAHLPLRFQAGQMIPNHN